MKKIFLTRIFLLILLVTVVLNSCRSETQSELSNNNTKVSNVFKENSGQVASNEYFQVGDKRYVPRDYQTEVYNIDGKLQYFLNLNDKDYTITDNLDTNGEIVIENPNTGEFFRVKNFASNETYSTFDILTSNGKAINGIKYFTNSSSKACVWCTVVEVVVTVIAIAVEISQSGSGGQAQCQSAMNDLHCPPGTSPYMNYSSGWFSSSCSVGCRK